MGTYFIGIYSDYIPVFPAKPPESKLADAGRFTADLDDSEQIDLDQPLMQARISK